MMLPLPTVKMPSTTGQSAGVLPFSLTQPSRLLPSNKTTAPSGGLAPSLASLGFVPAWAVRAIDGRGTSPSSSNQIGTSFILSLQTRCCRRRARS